MLLIITLIFIGLLLIAAEFLIIPGFGFVGILGLGSLVASCYFGYTEYGQMGLIVVILINVVLLLLSTIYILRSKTWKKISLNENITSRAGQSAVEMGIEVGQEGITLTRIAPMGHARINNQDVEVTSPNLIIEAEQQIVVKYIEENKIVITKI